MITKKLLILVVFLQINFCKIFCNELEEGDDLHSSVTALNEVFNVEQHFIDNLADYIIRSEENINYLKSFLNKWKEQHQNILQHYDYGLVELSKLKNLVHLLSTQYRFIINIPVLQDYIIATEKNTIENYITKAKSYKLPTKNDLNGVTLGLLRVQEVYNIPAEHIANGIINGIDFHTKFTASDCFEVALRMADLDCHYYAIEWYKMVLKRIDGEGWKGVQTEIDKNLIIIYLTHSQYQEGSIESIKEAIKIFIEALKENFGDKNALHYARNLITYLERLNFLMLEENKLAPVYPPKGALNRHNFELLNMLKKGCRGELKKPYNETKNLVCKYEIKKHPFLKIAPIKIEILNLSPYLVIVHDAIYDSEIEILKELSLNKLVRAQIWNVHEGKSEPSLVRTSKYVWFNNKTHPLIHTLNQRISDMTGMTMETSEDFQLMNYGIGGHYDIHPDYFAEPNEINNYQPIPQTELGNRIATVLFYMSDVAHGGGTVWPYINVLAIPRKGAAAFWYNLRHDGTPDYRSEHSACPIIVGSKWVVNKWIRMAGQIFRKPCFTSQY